ncbi:MAG TPA: ABC transporter ATP-binding protein [Burkholderiales bacterium]|nr:ABC transporter ATP-binding protein [Burkholderiales bacterium]
MNADLIVARALRKVYPGRSERDTPTLALEEFDLSVAEHEVACIVGPSGCGKTTLLNMIAGFEKPSGGELTMRGRPIAGTSPERSVVFQQPALFPWLNVWDNVTLGPRMRGVDLRKLAATAEHVLTSIGLGGFKKHYPYQLSGGMRQRVQIARVLIASPDVILMDEPFGSLDAQTRIIMHEVLLRLWAEYQPTIFFITHDVEEALILGDHVYVMSRRPGRLKAKIQVPFPRPRGYELIGDPGFAALRSKVVSMLREEWEAR